MKKFFNRIFMLFLVLFVLAFAVSCGEQEIPDDTDPEDPDLNLIYSAPAEIDVSDYNTFYFDGTDGSDSNSGRDKIVPKKSLTELAKIASRASANYPVRILLKRGSVFSGELVLANYLATENKPLIISDYGEANLPMPKFIGSGKITDSSYAVIKISEGNTRISNIEITDPYAYQGIYIVPNKSGAMENIVIDGTYVHDVNFFWDETRHDPANPPATNEELDEICPEFSSTGSYGRYYYRNNGGIIFYNGTSEKIGASWFENVWAINNRIERVARTGLYMATRWSNCPGVGYGSNKFVEQNDIHNNAETGVGYFMHKNVNFCGNKLSVIGGDGIILAGIDSFLEHNSCYYANYLGRTGESNAQGARERYFNAGIWVFNSDNISFRYNEAAYTMLRNGAGDGLGFDIDNASKNVYFEYNYAHHNEGGGLLLCNNTASLLRYDKDGNCISPGGNAELLLGDWGNNYCRNNIFAYNGKTDDDTRPAMIRIARQTDDFYCYNNIVIMGDIPGQSIVYVEDTKPSLNHNYANNIVYSAAPMSRTAKYSVSLLNNAKFENNLYFNVGKPYEGIEGSPLTDIDPKISFPEDWDGYDKITVLKPSAEAVYSSGIRIVNDAVLDILGNKTRNIRYLGAFAVK